MKQYIIDNQKIQDILAFLGCHNIKNKGNYYSASFPDGDNPQAIIIYVDNLYTVTYTHNKIQGDIITLVQDIKQCDFVSALKFIHQILNLKWDNKQHKKTNNPQCDILSVFTSKLKSTHKYNVNDIEIYDDDIIKEYADCLYKTWVKEGITEKARKVFQIGYSFDKNRIIIPEHWWCGNGELVGISSRTTNPLYKELGIPKYYPIIKYQKSKNLYGLYQNMQTIQQNKIVVVAEAQKSVLKRYSKLDGTVVACESHSLSDEQVSILIGLNVEICIAFDKDVGLQEVLETCEKFYNLRKVSFIYDFYDLLDEKESPMDKSNKIYKFLFEHRKIYNEKWHEKMLNGREKK